MLQFAKRDVERGGKMAFRKFVSGPHVEHGDSPASSRETKSSRETGSSASRAAKVVVHYLFDLRQVSLANAAKRLHQCHDFGVACKAVEHVLALAFSSRQGARAVKSANASTYWQSSAVVRAESVSTLHSP